MGGKQQNILIIALVGLLVISVLASPYWVVSQIKAAAKHQDVQALSEYIDFPSVRESFKAQVQAVLAEKAAAQSAPAGLAALGTAMAAAFVGPMVDALVTPQALALMFQGHAIPLDASAPAAEPSAEDGAAQVTMGYASYGRFEVTIAERQHPEKKMLFTLRREGLWAWKVATMQIVMPAQPAPDPLPAVVNEAPVSEQPSEPEVLPAMPADAAAAPAQESSPVPEQAPPEALAPVESVVTGPSFDCARANSVTEHLICEDAELSAQDLRLFELYKHAKAMTPQLANFKQETKAAYLWREANCTDKACLLDWYAARKVVYSRVIADAQVHP